MSNIFLNGDFSSPVLSNNSYIYTDGTLNIDFTTQLQDLFSWVGVGSASLNNGITSFGYPDPTNFTTNGQFVNIEQHHLLRFFLIADYSIQNSSFLHLFLRK